MKFLISFACVAVLWFISPSLCPLGLIPLLWDFGVSH